MKMKKLLAGVLSAAMVATAIPASMAFSGVSAAPEDSLVASYDLTTEEGREGWTATNDMGWSTNDGTTIKETDAGVVMTNGNNSYSIDNPYKEKDVSSFSIVMDVLVPDGANITEYEGLFGFNNNGDATFFGVNNKGTTVRYNANGSFFDLGVEDSPTTLSSGSRYVLTGNGTTITVYNNGVQVAQYTGDYSAAISFLNSAETFHIGYHCRWGDATTGIPWWSSEMKASYVAFYDSVLSADEVSALGQYTEDESISFDLSESADVWTINSGASWTAGTGITINSARGEDTPSSRAYILNPFRFSASSEGYSIVMDVKTGASEIDDSVVLFGLSSHTTWGYYAVTGNAASSFRANGLGNYLDIYTSSDEDLSDQVHRYVLTIADNSLVVYVDGIQIASYTKDDYGSAGTQPIQPSDFGDYLYFDLGQAVTYSVDNIDAYYDTVANTVFESVSFYKNAMTADEVAKNYAQSIADSLDLEVIGVQKGSVNDGSSAIRFVANMDKDAVNQYNAGYIKNVGWAWENNTAFTEAYSTAQVTTVTSDSSLMLEPDTKYAYTLVAPSSTAEEYYSAAPYAVITVGGTDYTFCYNGRGMSYVSNASDLVYAPTAFAEKTTDTAA